MQGIKCKKKDNLTKKVHLDCPLEQLSVSSDGHGPVSECSFLKRRPAIEREPSIITIQEVYHDTGKYFLDNSIWPYCLHDDEKRRRVLWWPWRAQ